MVQRFCKEHPNEVDGVFISIPFLMRWPKRQIQAVNAISSGLLALIFLVAPSYARADLLQNDVLAVEQHLSHMR